MRFVSNAPQSPRWCLRVKRPSWQVSYFLWVFGLGVNSPKALWPWAFEYVFVTSNQSAIVDFYVSQNNLEMRVLARMYGLSGKTTI